MMTKLIKLVALSLALLTISCSHHHYGRYDSNDDGQVTKSEWDQKHEKKFKKLDKNGDGVLSGDELGSKKHKKHCSNCKKCKSKKKCDDKMCSMDKRDCKQCNHHKKNKCDGKACKV